jgi:nucleotide exchange factor SIL1
MRLLLAIFSSLLSLALPAVSHATSDLICHTSDPDECYPRVFIPTADFQVVREDQQIPPGLHVRLDIVTGQKEAKIYDASADAGDAEYEAVQVVPGKGPVHVPLDSESPFPDSPRAQDYPLASNSADSYGPIRPPTTLAKDTPIFDAAITALLKQPPVTNLSAHLQQLRDLTDDMYWGLQLASNEGAIQELAKLVASPEKDAEQSARAASILASAGRNNAPAVSTMLSYHVPLSNAGEHWWSGTVWDAVMRVLQLDTQAEVDATSPHISASLEAKAYERYVSLLSSLLSWTPEHRTDLIDQVTRLAGPKHFNPGAAGASAVWDNARKRLLALLTDHYLPSSGGTPVGEEKVIRLAELRTHQYCTLLREWLGACEVAQRGWSDDDDGQRVVEEVRDVIERVMKERWEDGGCKGVPEEPSQMGKVQIGKVTVKEDL